MEFLEINEYINKYPEEYDLLKQIYKKTGNSYNYSLWWEDFLDNNRFICSNWKSYIISTEKREYIQIDSIYTKEKFRHMWFAKDLIANYPSNNKFLLFDTYNNLLINILEKLGAFHTNIYWNLKWRKQFIYLRNIKNLRDSDYIVYCKKKYNVLLLIHCII